MRPWKEPKYSARCGRTRRPETWAGRDRVSRRCVGLDDRSGGSCRDWSPDRPGGLAGCQRSQEMFVGRSGKNLSGHRRQAIRMRPAGCRFFVTDVATTPTYAAQPSIRKRTSNIEHNAVVATARGHAHTYTAALFKHGHRKTVIGQSASASQTGNARPDHSHGWLRFVRRAVDLHDNRPGISAVICPLTTDIESPW